jgi:AraC-like DNA-binding protein
MARGRLGITLMVRGTVEVTDEDGTRVVGPGQVFLRRPGRHLRVDTPEAPVTLRRWVRLEGAVVEPLLGLSGLDRVTILDIPEPRELVGLMKQAPGACCAVTYDDFQRSSTLAYEIAMELKRALPQGRLPDAVTRAAACVESRVAGKLTTREICRAAGVGSTRLNHLFNSHFGMPPLRYFIRRKMEYAGSLLLNPELSVKEAAYRTGFEDPAYFTRTFKAAMGVSPREFRKREAEEESA